MTIPVPGGPIPFNPTSEVFTGNPATVNDPFQSIALGNQWLANSGARMALGSAVYTVDAITGSILKWRYVRLNSTTTAALVVGPVYYKDNTRNVVTIQSSESLMALNGVAGLLVNTNAVNGNYIFILVHGHFGAVPAPASTAVGDSIIAAAGAQQVARVAANAAPTNVVLALAETAISGGNSDMMISVEDSGW